MRREFLGRAAMAIAAAPFGMSCSVDANDSAPRELAAIGGAAEWLNSPRLTPTTMIVSKSAEHVRAVRGRLST